LPAAKGRAFLHRRIYVVSPKLGKENPCTRRFGVIMATEGDAMAKGQQRSNREKKKPKQPPKPVAPATPGNRWPPK
jgi:hypothetical protein